MLADDLLDWVIRAISLFNTIILLWLGLTVSLNAERRRWGTYVASSGLLLGALVFAIHSIVLEHIFSAFTTQLAFWWRLIWLPFILSPYLWYLVIGWYTGVWRAGRNVRQRLWMAALSALGAAALGLSLVTRLFPTYDDLTHSSQSAAPFPGGISVLLLLYPAYGVLCFVLALAALRHPGGSDRFMGDLARLRARPWLIAASVALLAVTLCAGGVIIGLLHGIQTRQITFTAPTSRTQLMIFDALIAGLIALAVVLMGQGVVAYEIFTGKTLPRGGLARHWRRSLILAGGYSILVGGCLELPVDPMYPLVLATTLMTTFYALLTWRLYLEHERGMSQLRPFVASQRIYEQLLTPAPTPEVNIAAPFSALCEGVLGAKVAYLEALGPLAPLAGAPLAYPAAASLPTTVLAGLNARFQSPQEICTPLDPAEAGGAVWAVPLWSERGLIGVLLLGEKRDGSLYTQEEMELARATGERLIDTQASAAMAQRLMTLQRERLAESQIIDQRTRRVLHDEVLAHLHTALLKLTSLEPDRGPAGGNAEVVALLGEMHHQIANLLHAIPTTTTREVARLGLLGALRQAVEYELGAAFTRVTWQIEPAAEQAARLLQPLVAEVVFCAAREAIRNAARYGRNDNPNRPLSLTLSLSWQLGLQLAVEDDGVGLDASHAPAKGSGQGLALHSTMMTVIGGSLTAESVPGGSTTIRLTLPQALVPADETMPRREEETQTSSKALTAHTPVA
ncbi:MAG TPA: ATP-binding protein [Ktedonobacterales bacterium]|nr:ATP-binding protein [Ktedonobacterales bacterium]